MSIMIAVSGGRWSAYLILALFIATMVAVSVITSKKASSLDGFLLGNRGIGGWMSAFGYGTTYFSAVVFIGYAGTFGMSLGLGAVWIGIGNAVVGSLIAWLVLAKRTRDMTQQLDAKTMPEFFEKRYDSKYLKLYSAIVIAFFIIPYCTSVYQGIGYIMEAVLGIPFIWSVVIMAVLVGAYLFVGGFFANAVSNFIQGIIMLIGVVIMIVLMLKAPEVNGIEGLNKLIDSGYGFFPSAVSPTEHWFDAPAAQLIFNILLTSVGIWAVPQSVQKFYAIKNDRAITQGTIISFLFALLVGGGAYFNGSLARLFYPEMPAEGTANIIPNILLSNSLMNYAVLGFICVLVLSASMSTLSSLALVSASSIGVDVYKGYIKKDGDEKKLKILIRVLCFFFVALSAVFAILEVDAIVTLMSLSWGTMAGCFIGPYIYGLYWKKANKYGTYASITACLLITIILIFVFGDMTGGDTFISLLKLGIKKSPMIGVFCMGSSLIITPVASIVGERIEALVKAKKVA
ncbi:MAG: sodium:solute symporter family protein [Clostridia bacterium]|nr:sodium:solute symporter family protein [Clostridia bacterium]